MRTKDRSKQLPKYWADANGVAILKDIRDGVAVFRRVRGGNPGVFGNYGLIEVPETELYRSWHPDLGFPVPPGTMPSICERQV